MIILNHFDDLFEEFWSHDSCLKNVKDEKKLCIEHFWWCELLLWEYFKYVECKRGLMRAVKGLQVQFATASKSISATYSSSQWVIQWLCKWVKSNSICQRFVDFLLADTNNKVQEKKVLSWMETPLREFVCTMGVDFSPIVLWRASVPLDRIFLGCRRSGEFLRKCHPVVHEQ